MRKKSFTAKLAAASALVAVALAGVADDTAAAEYYDGKVLTLIVGFGPGGADSRWRLVAPLWAKNIPGKPTVIVKNMPGAGAVKAANFVYEKAKPDGLTLYTSPWSPVGVLIKAPGIRADYSKMPLVGAMGVEIMAYARKDIVPGGITDSIQISDAPKFKMGGVRPSSPLDLLGRLSLDLMGAKYTYVPGFRGAAKMQAAVQRKETDMTNAGTSSYISKTEPTFIKTGDGHPLWYYQPANPDGSLRKFDYLEKRMPGFAAVYRKKFGKDPSGIEWEALKWLCSLIIPLTHVALAPPGTPEEALKALRTGFSNMAGDPEFVKASAKAFGVPPSVVDLDQAAKLMASIADTEPRLKTFYEGYIEKAR